MPTTYEDLLVAVRQLQPALDRPPVVAITGHGGAGKSTLATRLGADLGVTTDQIVRTDSLYAPDAGPKAGRWEQHDWARLAELLAAARAGARRLTYEYRWYAGQNGPVDEPMPPVVIVEGIRLIGSPVHDLFDLAVWLDLDPDTAGARAVARNTAQGDSHEELDLWRTKWIPEGWAYQHAERPAARAHLVLPAPGTS